MLNCWCVTWPAVFERLMSGIAECTRRLHVRYPTLLPDFNEIWVFSTDFHKVPNFKFHRNLSNGSRADTYRETDRWTSRMELVPLTKQKRRAPSAVNFHHRVSMSFSILILLLLVLPMPVLRRQDNPISRPNLLSFFINIYQTITNAVDE
jgi:hypothetical protein